MKAVSTLKFVFIAIFTFFLFWGAISIFAVTTPPPEEPPCEPIYETTYSCTAGCGGQLQEQTCEKNCGGGCSGWTTTQSCSAWQTCDSSALSCSCAGECLQTPKNPRYYDNPTYSDQPNKNIGNSNIKLPVKLDWDNILGWGQTDGPQSYVLNLNGGTIKNTSRVLNNSEYNIQADQGSCFLKSDSNYNWDAKACCTANGENCGGASSWDFKTNAAPEPVDPYDPDWQGQEAAFNIPFEGLMLKWCETPFPTNKPSTEQQQPLSFKLNFYIVANDKEICHTEFNVGGNCRYQILLPEPEAGLLYPLPEFSNDKYNYFTKDTTYAWDVSACKDISYQDCTDLSQKWRFSTKEFLIGAPGVIYPPNDPLGTKPAGLPVAFRWGATPGAKSYIYEINSIGQGKTKSPSISFDYPKLNINTPYNWKIKNCSDYEGLQCESNWSETFYFKTTGQAPKLNNPKGSDVPIPTKFVWEDISGAQSYIFKIQGGGLNLEKIIEKSEFSLDYPDLKQETSYTWQVKTCARKNGIICGSYSAPQDFKTFKLPPPQNPSPEHNGSFFTYQKNYVLSWEQMKEANFYQYEVDFINVSPNEIDKSCLPGKLIPSITTRLNNGMPLPLACLGDYQWKVRACFDKDCQEAGNWSNNLIFSLIEKEVSKEIGGIVSCGKTNDNPATPWNEREPCQFRHIFLVIRNIIDFVLWKIAPLLLVLLVLVTGLIFYFSIRFQAPTIKVKSLWKAAAIGYGVIFLSWTILNLFLSLAGFNVGIFGQWWQINP